jgi:hypothetical protein
MPFEQMLVPSSKALLISLTKHDLVNRKIPVLPHSELDEQFLTIFMLHRDLLITKLYKAYLTFADPPPP